ncbi:hypothetical protein D9615_002689 [Tricholomella constricta]|uniref:Uncharacterized protein n=1 Tax=Tricholomella constricta TaxID=117010 RepID=A0A8H5HN57_9AGAR|nr:hypothetical protein D9615_002689 [Tricholomella constricta]
MLSSRPVPLGMDSHVLPSKTPGRNKARAENAVPMTVHGKGKEMTIRTPFPAQKAQKDIQTTQAQGKPVILTTRPNARPLGDKTPFPNRARTEQFQTPLPKLAKFPVLSLLESQTLLHPNKTPDSQLRPSSARKHVRVPRSASRSFETPVNNGNHWDVSELSIVIPEAQNQETLPEDDHDEIEYMPPNNLDLAYQPPFDFELPDYKNVGKTLMNHAYSYPYDDSPVIEIEVKEDDVQLSTWDTLPLKEIESDDPFHKAVAQKSAITPPLKSALPKPRIGGVVSRPVPGAQKAIAVSRPAVATRVPSSAILKPAKDLPSRPGTSNSVVPSTRSTIRPNTVRNAALSTALTPVALKPRTIGVVPAPRAPKPPARSTSAIPSRPATAAAIRSRMPSTTVAATSVRRPATSTSSYKTTPASASLRSASSKVASAVRTRPGAPTNSAVVQPSDLIVLVAGGLELDDDFRFEV